MRRNLLITLVGLLMMCAPSVIIAQNSSLKAVADTTSLRDQFDYVYHKSNTYEQYKVVKMSSLNLLKQNSLDSIKTYKDQISNNLQEVNKLNKNLTAQNAEIKSLKEELKKTQNSKDSISFLGMEITKGAYNTIMWAVIFILAVLSFVLFSLFKRGHLVVKATKKRLAEVQEDLEKLRKNALVREQKLARELMDYKLKNKSSR
ncbi:MAG TPA: hypothetical protein VKA27_10150 [Sunxiuqinia sp.]|nr:hypothetical protein [Sunxiuqinia sp.]